MPYITKERRLKLNTTDYPENAGDLNFKITSLIKTYIDINGLCYQNINDILGALEGAKQEFYRRVAVPYENSKIKLNGDVYDTPS